MPSFFLPWFLIPRSLCTPSMMQYWLLKNTAIFLLFSQNTALLTKTTYVPSFVITGTAGSSVCFPFRCSFLLFLLWFRNVFPYFPGSSCRLKEPVIIFLSYPHNLTRHPYPFSVCSWIKEVFIMNSTKQQEIALLRYAAIAQSVIFCGQFNTCPSVPLPTPAFALV